MEYDNYIVVNLINTIEASNMPLARMIKKLYQRPWDVHNTHIYGEANLVVDSEAKKMLNRSINLTVHDSTLLGILFNNIGLFSHFIKLISNLESLKLH